jgi:tryptophan halogenase
LATRAISVFPRGLPKDSPLLGANPAMHLDSSLMQQYLSHFAEQRRVNLIHSHIVQVNMKKNGSIDSLDLNNRQTVQGDFFIDCSGFRGLLIDEALGSPFRDWSKFLPCDRVVALQTAVDSTSQPFTVSRARECGWTWRIPLQTRVSSGYVYSSGLCSDAQAARVLGETAVGEPLHDPKYIPLRAGMREEVWKKNCIALGLSGGFLEPLESANIHLVTQGVELLLDLFPDIFEGQQEWPGLAAEYNHRMRTEYEEIRDFTILHYCTTRRVDSEFWRRCHSNSLPDSLVEKIELFSARGELPKSSGRLFTASNWQAVFTGMGVIPRSYHPLVDMADFGDISSAMLNHRKKLEKAVANLPAERMIQA